MKTEHQLNSHITATLKQSGQFMYLKASEKYMAGVSDFLVWHKGIGLAMEVKMAKKKTMKGKLLGHPFSSKQISFLEGFSRIGGGKAFGVVCVLETKRIYPVKWCDIPKNGNWSAPVFMEKHGDTFTGINEIEDLLWYMYREG